MKFISFSFFLVNFSFLMNLMIPAVKTPSEVPTVMPCNVELLQLSSQAAPLLPTRVQPLFQTIDLAFQPLIFRQKGSHQIVPTWAPLLALPFLADVLDGDLGRLGVDVEVLEDLFDRRVPGTRSRCQHALCKGLRFYDVSFLWKERESSKAVLSTGRCWWYDSWVELEFTFNCKTTQSRSVQISCVRVSKTTWRTSYVNGPLHRSTLSQEARDRNMF